MSVLLVFLMLTESACVHGFVHTHTDEGASHSHKMDGNAVHKGASHSHSHLHHHNFPEAQSKAVARNAIASIVSHAHLDFFGFDLSIPSSERSSEYDFSLQTFILQQSDCIVVPGMRSLDCMQWQTLVATPQGSNALLADTSFPMIPQVPSVLLCDSARFECTGVLLI